MRRYAMVARTWGVAGLFLVLVLTPARADVAGWVLYTHPDKLMSARFPEKPKEAEQDVPTEFGNVHLKAALVNDGEREYVATAILYSYKGKFDLQKGFDEARNRALGRYHGKVLSEKPTKLDGFVGREVWWDGTGPNGRPIHGVYRIFGTANPPTAFIALTLRFTDKPDPDFQRFLDSIHLGKKVERQP
jgi:hypothetical protein